MACVHSICLQLTSPSEAMTHDELLTLKLQTVPPHREVLEVLVPLLEFRSAAVEEHHDVAVDTENEVQLRDETLGLLQLAMPALSNIQGTLGLLEVSAMA